MNVARNTYGIVMAILLVVGAVVFFAHTDFTPVHAASSDNVIGYAWSDMPDGSDQTKTSGPHIGRGAGWISMNSNGLDNTGDPTNYSSTVDYGVNVDMTTGNVTGYGWSEHMGWIDFSGVTVDTETGEFAGMANFAAGGTAQSGGWDGDVSMNGTSPDYGVIMTPAPGSIGNATIAKLDGYAWGGDVIGWIDFSRVSVTTVVKEAVCTDTDADVHTPLADLTANQYSDDNECTYDEPVPPVGYCYDNEWDFIDTEQAFKDYNEDAEENDEPVLERDSLGDCKLEDDMCKANSDTNVPAGWNSGWFGVQTDDQFDAYNDLASQDEDLPELLINANEYCYLEQMDIEGCTDEDALNYNPLATEDDDSCSYTRICDGTTEECDNIQFDDFREI